MWQRHMPQDDYIVDRYLALEETSNDGTRMVRISQSLFARLVQEAPPRRLELRLQIETRGNNFSGLFLAGNSPIDTNNHGRHPSGESTTSSSINSQNRDTVHGGYRNPAYESGLSAYSAGRYHDACVLFQTAIDYFRERGNLRQEAECLIHLGTLYRHSKDYPNARMYLSNAREIYENIGGGCLEQQLQCDRQLAQVNERAGDYRTALHAYERIRATACEKGFRKQEAWCAYSLGRLHNEIRLYDNALEHLNQATEIAQSLQNLEIEAFAAEESGRSEELRKNMSQAREHYERARIQFFAMGRGRRTADEDRAINYINIIGYQGV
ncbi:unnamed protein product [Rhizoctonia solani]|uniref:Tetratricopeptide repeat protein 29 n=1 Tax=Rhizoctonia solani TaxID=456999 RepID=A0A8H3HM09_9AGAM|nr:unnamed protein product [Rhizoctonia solani]